LCALGVLSPSIMASFAQVLKKTKATSLEEVKNINLWGCKLEDISIVGQMPNVEIVSLSVNSISSLETFTNTPKLKELYLRKNKIRNLNEVRYLEKLPNLKVLWLCDNPCVNNDNYRKFVIRTLTGLTKLDNSDISDEERSQAVQDIPADWSPEAVDPSSPMSPQRGNEAGRAASAQADQARSPRLRDMARAVPPSPATQNRENVVKAIMFLLDELDTQGLEIVKDAVNTKIGLQRYAQ